MTRPYHIMTDRLLGQGYHGQVFEACTPQELKEKASHCQAVGKIENLLENEHADLAPYLKKLWLERLDLQKKAAKLGLAPAIWDYYLTENLPLELQDIKSSRHKHGAVDQDEFLYGVSIMKRARGVSADSLKESKGTVKKELCRQLKEGIEKLHKAGIYHGDVNLSNVFVDPLEFIDFGLSWPISSDPILARKQREVDSYLIQSYADCPVAQTFRNRQDAGEAAYDLRYDLKKESIPRLGFGKG